MSRVNITVYITKGESEITLEIEEEDQVAGRDPMPLLVKAYERARRFLDADGSDKPAS